MNVKSSNIWQNKRTLVVAWLIMFFPVGLYAVWTGELFDRQKKWIITGVLFAVLILFSGGGVLDFLVAIILAPLAVFLCWRDPVIANMTTYLFGAGAVMILIFYLSSLAAGPGPMIGGTCEAVQTFGNCTYYRDDQCNVIGQYCE